MNNPTESRDELGSEVVFLGSSKLRLGANKPIALGAITLGLLVVAITFWTIFAPLASATISEGIVISGGNRKLVQAQAGGVIKNILIREGDLVAIGQVLVTLDASRAYATLHTVESQLALNVAQSSRIAAERAGSNRISFPDEVGGVLLADYPDLLQTQIATFDSRRSALAGHLELLRLQASEATAAVQGASQQVIAENSRIALTETELAAAEQLAKDEFGTRLHVLDIRRSLAQLKSQLAIAVTQEMEAQSRIAQSIAESDRIKAESLAAGGIEEEQLARERLDFLYKIELTHLEIAQASIIAPTSGTVVEMAVHTEGGVVMAGATLMEIVPEKDPLVIETQIVPLDISSIVVGGDVEVRLHNPTVSTGTKIRGRVVYVSADRLYDRYRGTPYFVVRIEVDQGLPQTVRSAIRLGADVSVFIANGSKPLLRYLAEPVVEFFSHALKE